MKTQMNVTSFLKARNNIIIGISVLERRLKELDNKALGFVDENNTDQDGLLVQSEKSQPATCSDIKFGNVIFLDRCPLLLGHIKDNPMYQPAWDKESLHISFINSNGDGFEAKINDDGTLEDCFIDD